MKRTRAEQRVVRAAKKRAIMRLYKAVAHYVKMNGGKVVVAGGIQIQTWPSEHAQNFVIGIKCAGRKPGFALDKPRRK